MTFQELRYLLNTMTDNDLQKEITVLLADAGEFVQDVGFRYADATDDLEYGTPYLIV